MGAGTVTVAVPPRFYDDHVARDLPGGTVVKRTARLVHVELDRAGYDELLADARYYAGDAMTEFAGDGGLGLVGSARATVRRLLATRIEEG
jgi:hypothetical protein